ncbi:MAG TPA: response regulator [Candidatus Pacearchaeota archaeon]|nr:response regulator [Candidatus Paceibacterota bacterium]HOK00833.1 response regulator [Candidatus Pacearchaeota archaeon]
MKKILLVEDDPFLIDIYTSKLEKEGFSVKISESGEDCFKKINQEKPDLILLDIILPKIDGWEVLKKIKSDEKLKNIKIIILSNLYQKEDIEKGLSLGADKYLIKANYDPKEVIEEIKKILNKK